VVASTVGGSAHSSGVRAEARTRGPWSSVPPTWAVTANVQPTTDGGTAAAL